MGVDASALLVTVAPTGAETSKEDCPQLPTTLEELVQTAQACEQAGAAMIHVHIRDGEHRPTLDPTRLRDTVVALRESTDLLVQLSTGGSVHDPLEQRLKVLDAEPDSCSLTMGTTNFGDDVFLNPWPFVCELYQLSQEREVVPEFELFDLGHVAAMHRLLDRFGLPYGGRVHVDLVMGVPGGMPGTADALVAAVAALPGRRDQLVGDGDRALDPGGRPRQPEQGRPPAGRHGGRADPGPRRPGRAQPSARGARGPARRARAAAPDDDGRGARAARRPRTSVDERLYVVAEDLLDERRRAGDRDAAEQVGLDDARAAGRTACTPSPGHRPAPRQQVRERGGQVEGERLGPSGHAEPGRLAGQPERHVGTGGHAPRPRR